MFHPSTERLIDYWREKKGPSALPRRADVNPGDFLELLPQVFILGKDGGKLPFRLAGGFVSDLHARDLRGQDALSLWALAHRLELKSALDVARKRRTPVVVTADIRAHGVPSVGMEVLFAPLQGASGETDRFLGLYQPIARSSRWAKATRTCRACAWRPWTGGGSLRLKKTDFPGESRGPDSSGTVWADPGYGRSRRQRPWIRS
jgi:hypothetical protein